MIRTRFAPSPTGFLHIGGLRTAIYAYALAKHSQGDFLLRIEDTDQKREVKGASEKIKQLLKIFNLNWDGEVVTQSHRAASGVYRDAALKLVESGHAYYSQSEARNAKTSGYAKILRDPDRDRGLTSGAIKLRVPDDEKISFHDFVLNKDIVWDSNKVPDVVLLKSDGSLPTYHLAQAVDDHDSKVSHVVRSAEWLTSTPIHVLVHRYLGYELPKIGHPTAILDPDGGKLSKRKGNVSVEQFLSDGYLPEAILNFVLLLGWAPKNNQEFFTLQDFVQEFDINGFQKSNPIFNLEKLNWFNGQYIRKKSDSELVSLVKPFMKNNLSDTQITQIVIMLKDRLVKLGDVESHSRFLFEVPEIDISLFADREASLKHLLHAKQHIHLHTDELIALVKQNGWKVGDFFMTLRIAICGAKFTPPLNNVIEYLGTKEVLHRIENSVKLLE